MRYSLLSSLFLVLMNSAVLAQMTPDAGALMRQTEQMLRQSQMQQYAQRRPSLPPAMVWADTDLVTANSFKFMGNKRVSTERLQAVAAPFLLRPLSPHEFEHLTEAIADLYRSTGWVVQAYIPRQDFQGGEVSVQVIESIPPSAPR